MRPGTPLHQQGWVRLCGCIAVMGILWLGVFPRLATWAPVQNHIELMRENDIEAGAMFYSELNSGVIPDQKTVDEMLASRRVPLMGRASSSPSRTTEPTPADQAPVGK